MPRIHLPVLTDRSPISSNTGSGASVMTVVQLLGQHVRQASAGRPLTSMAQLPQMPARQTKSNCSDAVQLVADLAQRDEQRHARRVVQLIGLPVRRDSGCAGL
jgi:hypothetical protein